MRPFYIDGHGHEDPVDFIERFRLPQNTWLVLFTNGGVPLFTREACRFLDFVRNKKNLHKLNNPEKYKNELSKYFPSIRVYKPGDYIPNISTSLLSDHKEKYYYNKSGVYEIPNVPMINRKRFPVPNANPIKLLTNNIENTAQMGFLPALRCYKYSIFTVPGSERLTQEEYEELYRGSLVKPGYANYDKMDYNLSSMITMLGEGVYYFGGCRSTIYAKEEDPMYEKISALLFSACYLLRARLQTVHALYSLNKKNPVKQQDILNKANITVEDLNNFDRHKKSRAYKRLNIFDIDDIDVKTNIQYHDDFVNMARFILLHFQHLIQRNTVSEIEEWLAQYGVVHPHQSNLDKSDEQQHGIERYPAAKRMRSHSQSRSHHQSTSNAQSNSERVHGMIKKIPRVSPRDRKLSPMSVD